MSTRGVVTVAAVDLGATSGRVMLARVGPQTLELEQVARFPNGPVNGDDGLHWDFDGLYANVLDGLAAAGRIAAERGERIASIGIDSWAVDYGLLGDDRVLGAPFHYRDSRSAAAVDAVHAAVPFAELYRENGLQFLPFNTLYQLAVDRDSGRLAEADVLLLIPDLFAWRLTGARVAETTNASTTGLLALAKASAGRAAETADDVAWNDELIERLGLPLGILPALVSPGTRVGTLLPEIADATGLPIGTPVTAVGSHDTASAVVGVPMTNPNAAYISCGTWGLVGVELERPVVTDAARDANFTNEGGVDGRVRFLHNVMGLWLLSECLRTWTADGLPLELPRLLAEAADLRDPVAVFDVDDERFLAPGDMPARIAAYCAERDLPVPHAPVAFARSILESLADAFARAVRAASELSGKPVDVVHLVGGGAQNELLCRLTAARCGLPVLAGPVEATAIGNVLVQARAVGAIDGELERLRELVARTHPPVRYEPSATRIAPGAVSAASL
ncbi:MAG TPA: rhamnulokinase family protein [Humibacter sp.]|nr:rhamnulokinase family protein [Humibacter sp.]